MKTFVRFSFAAIVTAVAVDVFAGFSDGLDLSALNEMLEIDDSIDQISISANGERGGNIWQPADISAEKDSGGRLTGNVVYNGGGMTEGINSAKGYIEFGKYDDEASLNAFFMRDDFLNSRGDIMYLIENLSDCYTKAEDKNAALLESVMEQVEANVEDYLANEGSGGKSSTASKMIAAYNKFYKSFENSVKNEENRKKSLIQKFESLKKSASNKNKQIILEAMMKVMMDNYNNTLKLKNTVYANYEKFKQLRMSYLNSMNTLGAYLGSTNAMEFCSSEMKFEDLDEEDLERWYKFSPPGRLRNGLYFGLSGEGNYSTIFDSMASAYGVFAFDIDGSNEFREHFGINVMAEDAHKGFYQSLDGTGTVTTNWNARGIDAPKNWADGTSIIVTNGVFTAKQTAGGYAIKITGTKYNQQGVNYVVLGSGATTNNLTFATANDSNVKVEVDGDSSNVTVTFGVYYK